MDKDKKIVKSGVKEIKENEFKKFFKNLFAEDVKSVGPRLFSEVMMPGVKRLIVSVGQTALAWIFGDTKATPSGTGLGSNVSYSSYYLNQQRAKPNSYVNTPDDRESILTISMQEISDRNEAEEVLAELKNSIELYGHVKVSEYYDLLGKRSTYTDERYGWRNLDSVVVKPTVSGYILTLPPAVPLNIKQL